MNKSLIMQVTASILLIVGLSTSSTVASAKGLIEKTRTFEMQADVPTPIQKVTIGFGSNVTVTQFGPFSIVGREGIFSSLHYSGDPIDFRVFAYDFYSQPLTQSQTFLKISLSPQDSANIVGVQLLNPNGVVIYTNNYYSEQYGVEMELWLEQSAQYQNVSPPNSTAGRTYLSMPDGQYTIWAKLNNGTYRYHTIRFTTHAFGSNF